MRAVLRRRFCSSAGWSKHGSRPDARGGTTAFASSESIMPQPKTDLTLLHGTTVSRAREIVNSQTLSPTQPLYVVIQKHRDLAEHFARRKAGRERGQPAIVRILVADADFQSLHMHGDAALVSFDPGDDPLLRLRNQWVISQRGVQILNRHVIEIEYDAI